MSVYRKHHTADLATRPTITGEEFRLCLHWLGMSEEDAAYELRLPLWEVRSWHDGTLPVPVSVVEALRGRLNEFERETDRRIVGYTGVSEPVFWIRRAGVCSHSKHRFRWWRAVASQVAEEVPNLRVAYFD